MLRRLTVLALSAVLCLLIAVGAQAQTAKNVILLIADGRGFNTLQAGDMFAGSQAVYEGADWVRFGVQTTSADNPAGYDPAAMAADFSYSMSGATDSASSATAMYTGEKIYDGQINYSTAGLPLTTIFEKAAAAGRSVGAVSSVQFSHATPAAVYAHNTSRSNYADIALEAINGDYSNNLKVVMGAGHPDHDNDGVHNTSVSDKYVGNAAGWTALQNGDNGWTLVETRTDFQNLATGATPDKVFGVAQVNSTLQEYRTGSLMDPTNPFNTNVPALVDMTRAVLNVLDNNSQGFAVMIEGGAIDWAAHSNRERIIEEQADFNASVQAVVDYLDAGTNGNRWSNTLVIVTSDHETGMLMGDGTGTYFDVDGDGRYTAGIDYAHLVDKGPSTVPGMQFNSGSHTNQLVPLFARGPGSELFADHVIGTDANLTGYYNLDSGTWTGEYIDNTSIYHVMSAQNIPEPATVSLIGLCLASLAAARRRRASSGQRQHAATA